MKALFRVPGEPSGRTAQYLVVAALAVLVAAYAACVFLTRSSWAGSSLQDRTSVTFLTQSSDGYPPSPDALAQADEILRKRVAALGLADAEIVVNNDEFTVAATGNNGGALRGIGDIGRLYLFPHGARRIADEKELRQNTDQQVQLLALQFQATRCNEQDVLVGHDDPNRPLVTCSADGTTVYLLDRSILGGDQVTGASALVDDRGDGRTVITGVFTGSSGRER